jgi:hypothetical protein
VFPKRPPLGAKWGIYMVTRVSCIKYSHTPSYLLYFWNILYNRVTTKQYPPRGPKFTKFIPEHRMAKRATVTHSVTRASWAWLQVLRAFVFDDFAL